MFALVYMHAITLAGGEIFLPRVSTALLQSSSFRAIIKKHTTQ